MRVLAPVIRLFIFLHIRDNHSEWGVHVCPPHAKQVVGPMVVRADGRLLSVGRPLQRKVPAVMPHPLFHLQLLDLGWLLWLHPEDPRAQGKAG